MMDILLTDGISHPKESNYLQGRANILATKNYERERERETGNFSLISNQ